MDLYRRPLAGSQAESIHDAAGPFVAKIPDFLGVQDSPTLYPETQKAARRRGDVAKTGEQVQAFVAANPGSGIEAIAKGLKRKSKDLKLSMKGLLKEGALRMEGVKRGAKYFVKA